MIWGFESRRGLGIFLFTAVSRPALGPTQPLIQWLPGYLSLGVKRPGREADHSHPCSAEVKNPWRNTSIPPICFIAWCSGKNSTGATLPLPFTLPSNAFYVFDVLNCSLVLFLIHVTSFPDWSPWICRAFIELTPWSRIILEKLIIIQPIKKFSTCYGTLCGSLICSQGLATGPYPLPYTSTPYLPTLFPKMHSNIILPSTPSSYEGSLPLNTSSSTKIEYCMHFSSHPRISDSLIWSHR
jgi:hypothetical protein